MSARFSHAMLYVPFEFFNFSLSFIYLSRMFILKSEKKVFVYLYPSVYHTIVLPLDYVYCLVVSFVLGPQ